MYYIFAQTDSYGSRKRVIYKKLRNALAHFWRYKKIPYIKRNANDFK